MDDIEARGLSLRLLREESTMLREALHAAHKGKMHVVIDHIERVLDRMDALQAKMRGGDSDV